MSKMTVLAIPCNVAFKVDPSKSKEFLEVKPDLEQEKKMEVLIKKLNIIDMTK